jgi:hypothetical protein
LLDEGTGAALASHQAIDTETIEAIFEAATAAFGQAADKESSQTAMQALCERSPDGKLTIVLKAEYSGLDAEFRYRCEQALTSLTEKGATITASAIFASLAAALAVDRETPGSQTHDLITAYTSELAQLWQAAGLRARRANRPEEPGYKSRFHRFADLVLTVVVEPDSLRHEETAKVEAERNAIWARYAKLPAEVRPAVSSALRRRHWEWLVSDHHIK